MPQQLVDQLITLLQTRVRQKLLDKMGIVRRVRIGHMPNQIEIYAPQELRVARPPRNWQPHVFELPRYLLINEIAARYGFEVKIGRFVERRRNSNIREFVRITNHKIR